MIASMIRIYTTQKMFSIKDFFSKKETADLVTFTEEFLDGKLHFFCCATISYHMYHNVEQNFTC